jgi:hypothetical protein
LLKYFFKSTRSISGKNERDMASLNSQEGPEGRQQLRVLRDTPKDFSREFNRNTHRKATAS